MAMEFIDISLIINETPNTTRMFIIFEPIIFPIAKLASPLFMATKVVANSGKDVPIATIVIPIMIGGIPKISANPTAPSTKKCEPKPKAKTPNNENRATFCVLFDSIWLNFHAVDFTTPSPLPSGRTPAQLTWDLWTGI